MNLNDPSHWQPAPPPQQPYYPNQPNQPQQQYYPPQAYAPPTPAPKTNWKIVSLAVVGGLVLVAILFVVVQLVPRRHATPDPWSVSVTGCSSNGSLTTLSYTLTNKDTVEHSYLVSGAISHTPLIPDVVEGVAPGEAASGQLVGSTSFSGVSSECRITDVQQR